MKPHFKKLIDIFLSLFKGKISDTIEKKPESLQEAIKVNGEILLAIEKKRADILENFAKENMRFSQTQLSVLLSQEDIGWLSAPEAAGLKKHIATYQKELLGIFNQNMDWLSSSLTVLKDILYKIDKQIGSHHEKEKICESWALQAKDFIAVSHILNLFPEVFTGQIKAYYVYEELLRKNVNDYTTVNSTSYTMNYDKFMIRQRNFYQKSLGEVFKKLQACTPIFNTPVEKVLQIITQYGAPNLYIEDGVYERSLLSASATKKEAPLTESDTKEEVASINSEAFQMLVELLGDKNLSAAQKTVAIEIQELCMTLLSDTEALTGEDKFKINNTLENNLPQALREYVSINPRYKAILKTESGKTVDNLLEESLGQMKTELSSMVEKIEGQKFKNLQVTHKYLTAKL